jgi:hypothetical protein
MTTDTNLEQNFSDTENDQPFDLDEFDTNMEYGDNFIQTNGFVLRFDIDDEG